MAIAKYNLEWCKSYAKEHNGECLSTEYLGRTTKLHYRCENGHEFQATPYAHFYKKSWCNECSNRDVKHSIEFVKEFIKNKNGILHSTEYINVRQKLDVECSSGHRWNPTFQNIFHNQSWCPFCAGVDKRVYGKRTRVKSP